VIQFTVTFGGAYPCLFGVFVAMDLRLRGQPTIYDDALMGILQNCGKLQPFLDAVFSFLARRTDFYILMHHDKAKMGFPPGVAESMVMQVSVGIGGEHFRPCT